MFIHPTAASAPIPAGEKLHPTYPAPPPPPPQSAGYLPQSFPQETYYPTQYRGPAMPYLSTDQYPVHRIDMGLYGAQGEAYPTDQFDYEIPGNVCLGPGTDYPESATYFPGRQTYQWKYSPERGYYEQGSNLSWCPRQTWNGGPATQPSVPLGGAPVFSNQAPELLYPPPTNFVMPVIKGSAGGGGGGGGIGGAAASAASAAAAGGPSIPTQLPAAVVPEAATSEIREKFSELENRNRRYGYPLGGSSELASIPLLPLPNTVNMGPKESVSNGENQVNLISPGEQTNWAHRVVRENRYPGQIRQTNIYKRPADLPADPYTPSLWQTPLDSSKNVISVGLLSNPYSGELTEVFQDQMPLPTTSKGQFLESQLHHPNPKLVAYSGGFNHHTPPPRKTEQPGYIFNPVSTRGGSTPFGDQVYEPKLRQELTGRGMRDLYNNRNGDLVVEPGFAKEQPYGYIGYTPRIRLNPYVPPTQELEYGQYLPPMAEQPTDLLKREQFTPEAFAYKDPALVYDRMQYATDYLNGTEAIASIPIAAEHMPPQRSDPAISTVSYISPAYQDVGALPVLTGEGGASRPGPPEVGTLPTGPAGAVGPGAGLPVVDRETRHTGGMLVGALPAYLTPAEFRGGHVQQTEIRQTLEQLGTLPAFPMQSQYIAGAVLSSQELRSIEQLANLPSFPLQSQYVAGAVMPDLELRNTLKLATVENTYPVIAIQSNYQGATVLSEPELRESLKDAAEETGRTPAGPHDPNVSYVLPGWKALPTDRSFPAQSGPVDGGWTEIRAEPSEAHTLGYRGTAQEMYLAAQSMIPVAAGDDFNTRVVAPLQRTTARLEPNAQIRTRDINTVNIPTTKLIGEGLRETGRSQSTTPIHWDQGDQDL